MKAIDFHPEAKAELEAAALWYEAQREGVGVEFEEQVESGLAAIQRTPQAFPLYGSTELRKYVLRRFPYNVYYLELDDLIWVAAIAHQRRRPGYWAHRLP